MAVIFEQGIDSDSCKIHEIKPSVVRNNMQIWNTFHISWPKSNICHFQFISNL